MEHSVFIIHQKKRIALVAHDNMKQDLLEWAEWNKSLLINHELYATGTTGKLLENVLQTPIHKLQSGPLGGDQQVGAMISEGTLDLLIFFWDPLAPQPHDTDVKALLRIAVVWNIPVACDRASADFMISSTCMVGEYKRLVPNYDKYRQRFVQGVAAAVQAEESASADNTDGLVTMAEGGEQPPDPGAIADADATALD